jgi:hypothetical protein
MIKRNKDKLPLLPLIESLLPQQQWTWQEVKDIKKAIANSPD